MNLDHHPIEVNTMSSPVKFLKRSIVSLVLIVGIVCASPGALANSQVAAEDNPVRMLLPVVSKAAIVTPFGAFLDAWKAPYFGLPQMAAGGASWAHVPLYWSQVEGTEGVYDWGNAAGTENLLKAVSNHYMNTILYIDSTPLWALKAGFSGCGPVAPDKLTATANFLTATVAHYSAPPYNVKYYELWSEEDAAGTLGCWGDPSDLTSFGGAYYAEMLKLAYPAIKKGNPQAQVLFGGLLMNCNPDHIGYCSGDMAANTSIAHFLEGALLNGAGSYFDGISFHAYDYYGYPGRYSNANWGTAWNTTGPVSHAKVLYLKSLLDKYSITGKFMVNTEVAVLCGSATGPVSPECVSADHEATVSAYIAESYAGGIADGLLSMIWFSVSGWRGSQLLDQDFYPIKTYQAFSFARTLLGQVTFVRAVTEFTGVTGYEFKNPTTQQRSWILWSTTSTGNPHTITLSTTPLAVYDVFGAALPVGITVDVGLTPVFIQVGA